MTIWMGESNTVVSAYTVYTHLQQYCSHLPFGVLHHKDALNLLFPEYYSIDSYHRIGFLDGFGMYNFEHYIRQECKHGSVDGTFLLIG